jgi:hypothetical protein
LSTPARSSSIRRTWGAWRNSRLAAANSSFGHFQARIGHVYPHYIRFADLLKFLLAKPAPAGIAGNLLVLAHGALPVFLKHLDVNVCHALSLPPEAAETQEG